MLTFVIPLRKLLFSNLKFSAPKSFPIANSHLTMELEVFHKKRKKKMEGNEGRKDYWKSLDGMTLTTLSLLMGWHLDAFFKVMLS
ncbi:Hypothetical predicted protein [Olea europaea subsp. europaea]|uniref:Uncharacterized protein n=1 Tax=Olea europaea subsp. europaea TaxID=158383 RepID=A0A8S0SJ68_OLEEU|nr:Hypothetical predicted protein [Olea europaea subsp. europaea]